MLEVKNITRRFGGITANLNVSFKVEKGEIVGLIGPNGAGKSTMFNMISSIIPPSSGVITFEGTRIDTLPTYKIAPLGIARTFQNLQVFNNMSVIENIMVGQHIQTKPTLVELISTIVGLNYPNKNIYETAYQILHFFNIDDLADHQAGSLALGKLRLLEFARAYATNPKLILLDEIAAGLNHSETQEMSEIIQKVRDEDITIFIVEHDMDLVMSTCDRMIVLDQGIKIAEGTPHEIQNNEDVLAAYLGAEIQEIDTLVESEVAL